MTEAHLEHGAEGARVLVEAGGDSEGIRKVKAERFDRQTRIVFAGAAAEWSKSGRQFHGDLMGRFGRQQPQSGDRKVFMASP